MQYKDGTVFAGVWSEGSQVHGKTTKSSRSAKNSGSKPKKDEWKSKEDGSAPSENKKPSADKAAKKTVRKMKWMDYFGDPGEYTGEVGPDGMPDGKGSMKYDHGLMQEGVWRKGQFVEGSDMNILDGASAATKKQGGGRAPSTGGGKKRTNARGVDP